MSRPLCIRTVLDTRCRSSKYLYQVLLLAASWHKRARQTAPLEVLVIGEAPKALRRFLDDIDAQIRLVDPDLNDRISKTSNSIVGAFDADDQRILLLDNDTVLRSDLSELLAIGDQCIMGSVAGGKRVSDSQWTAIGKHLGFPPIRTTIPCIKERVRAVVEPGYRPRSLESVYVNAGVLLLPAGCGLGPLWRRYVRETAEFFENHPLRSDSVYGSCQAGLAMAIAKYGSFAWLDTRFNYRPDCFALGLEPLERIEIVHLTGVTDNHKSVARRIDDYWRQRMLHRFKRISFALEPHTRYRRLEIIEAVGEELLSLVQEYDLEKPGKLLLETGRFSDNSTWYQRAGRQLHLTTQRTRRAAARLRRCILENRRGESTCRIK